MFSVIVYGRNDTHGYNLHKRAAISFNAIAEVMSDPDDEILFVDYNTPDDHPTFPEAIHDTLLVPRDERQSLSDVLGELPDGFYQTPRFELPEMLWEAAFDRRDPAGNLAKLRDWSKQFHLNQVVLNALP